MKYSKIIEHLSKRGFATRKQWGKRCYVFFGMDTLPWRIRKGFNDGSRSMEDQIDYWKPCLADMKAEDWEIEPLFWDGLKDNFLPWTRSLPEE